MLPPTLLPLYKTNDPNLWKNIYDIQQNKIINSINLNKNENILNQVNYKGNITAIDSEENIVKN